MRRALILAAIALAGCETVPVVGSVSEPVTVKVPVMVAVPDELTRETPVYQRASGKVEEYWTQAERNTLGLEACNRDKAEIRALPVPND